MCCEICCSSRASAALIDPPIRRLGFSTDKALNGMRVNCEFMNLFNVKFRLVIRIDDPNAKEQDLQD